MNHDAEKEPSLFECNKVDAAKNGGPTFLVPECDSSRELAAFAGELEEAIAQKPQKIILNFVGMMTMSSDAVLLLHDVLCQRSPETKLVVKARSPLQGSAILLWLAGDERHIRPTAWMRFDINKPRRRGRFPRDEFGLVGAGGGRGRGGGSLAQCAGHFEADGPVYSRASIIRLRANPAYPGRVSPFRPLRQHRLLNQPTKHMLSGRNGLNQKSTNPSGRIHAVFKSV